MAKGLPIKEQWELRLGGQAFGIPPLWDTLLIGQRAPIGLEAARRMAERLAPGQFGPVRVKRGPVEAMLVCKSLPRAVKPEALRRSS